MADIELLIKIDENEYNNLIKRAHENIYALSHVDNMILHGTTLPKGHWILGGYDDNYYICDKCNYKASEYYFKPRYNYCPNCGAKMSEQEET